MADNTTTAPATTAAAETEPPQPGPAWPTVEPDPPPRPWDAARVDLARRILLETYAARASGEILDPDRSARDLSGLAPPPHLAQLVGDLAAQAQRQSQTDTREGRALRQAGIDSIASHLAVVSDTLAADAPEPRAPGAEHAAAADPGLAALLRTLVPADETAAADTADRDTAAVEAPVVLNRQTLATPVALRAEIRGQRDRAANRAPNDPAMHAMAVVDSVLDSAGFEMPAHTFAVYAAGAHRHPDQVAGAVRHLAGRIEQHLPDEAQQRMALGTYEHGRTLTRQLQGVASRLDRLAASPAALAQARAVSVLRDPSLVRRLDREPTVDRGVGDASPAAAPADVDDAPTAPLPVITDSEQAETVAPYRYNPELLPEHALLGSLVHSPTAIDELSTFLRARDFSTPETQATWQALTGLYRSGSLMYVSALPEHARQRYTDENARKLFQALNGRASTLFTQQVSDPTRLLGQLSDAAPAHSMATNGVSAPRSQMDLGRMVLEDYTRRQLAAMGVHLRRPRPLVTPGRASGVARGPREAAHLEGNLGTILAHADRLAARLAAATERTGPAPAAPVVEPMPSPARLPNRLRPVTAPMAHRAERDILHVALHQHATPLTGRLALRPEDFADVRHANTWRVITQLQAWGEPVNHVSVQRASHAAGCPHPILSQKALLRLANQPPRQPDRIARSLSRVVTASVSRARATSQRTAAALARNPAVPAATAVAHVRHDLAGLASRATTARHQHDTLDGQRTARQSGR